MPVCEGTIVTQNALTVPILFRALDHLHLNKLTHYWARELVGAGQDFSIFEQELARILLEDIINGRFDNAGPLRNGERSGLRLIFFWDRPPVFIAGRQIKDLILMGALPRDWLPRLVIVMKDAVLDFAERRALRQPSWWIGPAETSQAASSPTRAAPVADASSPVVGKRPRIMEYLIEHYPGGVPDPAHSPRKILRAALLKWDHGLQPLDEGTLKKAIDEYNASLPKPQT
jgi:hypothetical protein